MFAEKDNKYGIMQHYQWYCVGKALSINRVLLYLYNHHYDTYMNSSNLEILTAMLSNGMYKTKEPMYILNCGQTESYRNLYNISSTISTALSSTMPLFLNHKFYFEAISLPSLPQPTTFPQTLIRVC